MLRVRDNNVGLLGKRSPDSALIYLFLCTRAMHICSIFETDIGYKKGQSFLFWKLASYCYYDEMFRIHLLSLLNAIPGKLYLTVKEITTVYLNLICYIDYLLS